MVIKVQPSGIFFAKDLSRSTRIWVNGEKQLFLLQPILDQQTEWSSSFLPYNPGEIWISFSIPLDPACCPARSRNNSETNLCVLSASTRIEIFRRCRFRMQWIGN